MDKLIDLETLVKLESSAPHVTDTTAEAAFEAVQALDAFSAIAPTCRDLDGILYWRAGLKELYALIYPTAQSLPIDSGSLHRLGRVYRSMRLVCWRRNDGYHVAWSAAQLDILHAYLRIDPESSDISIIAPDRQPVRTLEA